MSSLFRAPAVRGIKVLDRSLFSKKLPTTAAMVKDNRNIAKYRKELQKSRDLLLLPHLNGIIAHPDPAIAQKGTKCIILSPEVNTSSKLFPKFRSPYTHTLTNNRRACCIQPGTERSHGKGGSRALPVRPGRGL